MKTLYPGWKRNIKFESLDGTEVEYVFKIRTDKLNGFCHQMRVVFKNKEVLDRQYMVNVIKKERKYFRWAVSEREKNETETKVVEVVV